MSGSLVREPVGVVGCITPWNFPLMQAVVKVAPALAAGCSVVLKPSPLASLTCVLLGEVAQEAGLPPGALNIVTGGPPGPPNLGGKAAAAAAAVRDGDGDGVEEDPFAHLIGRYNAQAPAEAGGGRGSGNSSLDGLDGDATGVRLARHPGIDKLSFTGSGATGAALLSDGAGLLRPTGLELGGKGAMLLLGDVGLAGGAVLDAAVDWAMVGIFLCSGQVCSATSRIIVDEVGDSLSM